MNKNKSSVKKSGSQKDTSVSSSNEPVSSTNKGENGGIRGGQQNKKLGNK